MIPIPPRPPGVAMAAIVELSIIPSFILAYHADGYKKHYISNKLLEFQDFEQLVRRLPAGRAIFVRKYDQLSHIALTPALCLNLRIIL